MVLPIPCLVVCAIVAIEPFAIRVIDEQTGRGVPLIELRTTDAARYWTDNAGLVAFAEPGLMGTSVYFHVKGHGYEYPPDGFGNRGKALTTTPGGEATIHVKRINIAERLYRITGGGLYRDSLLLGRSTPLRNPAINAAVLGQDSVVNGVLDGRLYWFWGDTNLPAYPLGNFHVPGATSSLPGQGGLSPSVGIDLTYLVDDQGRARPTAKLPGDGPTWIFGVVVIPGDDGHEHMMGSYVKTRGFMTVYEHGAVEFDPSKGEWIKRATWPEGAPIYPGGQPFVVGDREGRWVVFANDLPNTRVKADVSSYLDLSRHEGWTSLKIGSRSDRPEIERGAGGRLVLGWKRGTPPLTFDAQAKAVKAGVLKVGEGPIVLRDVETGKPIRPHTSSVVWNNFRKVWSMVVLESRGTSPLGEIWYAEADEPEGPWAYARKVVTHDRYSFYNPRLHPYFSEEDGRFLYFEGTYTHTFSGNPDQTPRYDYNQIMYRLDLADQRMVTPLPPIRPGFESIAIPCYLSRRPGRGLIAIVAAGEGGRLRADKDDRSDRALFYAAAPNGVENPGASIQIEEFVVKTDQGQHLTYASEAFARRRPELRPTGRTLCRVWPDPDSPSP